MRLFWLSHRKLAGFAILANLSFVILAIGELA